MLPKGESPRVDDHLARLLEVEARLEARVRSAEEAAARRVAEAREAARAATLGSREEVEAAARHEEREDALRHAEALAAIAAERDTRLAALRDVPDAEVARLARRVVAIVIEGDEVAS